MQTNVQVLLCTSNSMKYISEQIQSILKQIDVNISILCSDDMSEDGTYEYLLSLQNDHKNINVLPRVRKFGSAGKNFYYLINNAHYSNNDFIAFADHDDIWLTDKISTAVNCLEKDSLYGYSSSYTAFWENGKKIYVSTVGKPSKYDYIFSSAGPGCTFVIKSKYLREFNNYFLLQNGAEDIYHHDWLIYAWFKCKYPNSWHISSAAHILYRQHSVNETGVNIGLKARLKRLNQIKNNWYIDQILKILEFLKGLDSFNDIKSLFNHNRLKLAFNVQNFRRDFRGRVVLCLLILLGILNINLLNEATQK